MINTRDLGYHGQSLPEDVLIPVFSWTGRPRFSSSTFVKPPIKARKVSKLKPSL